MIISILSLSFKSYGQVARIPFELYDNKFVLLTLCVNDNKDSLCFFFDTGATSTLVDSAKAVRLGLKPNYEQNVSGAGGKKTYKVALNQTILITNEIKVANTHIVLDDLSRLQNSLGKKFDGIIGNSILKEYKTRIDFDKKVIYLYPFTAKLDVTEYKEISFDFLRGIQIPQFPVTMELKDGQKFTDTVFFDSGAGLYLFVNTPFKTKNKLLEIIGKTITSESENLSSKSVQQEAIIKSLQIHQFNFGEMPIQLSSDVQGVSSYEGYLGILGADIIKRFNIVTDYNNKKLYLKPNLFFNSPIEFDLTGIGLKLENGVVKISRIIKECEAYGKGLRENNTIISINDVSNATIDVFRQMLKKEQKKITIKYLSNSGERKEINITLKRVI
jgi:hypothetical protein